MREYSTYEVEDFATDPSFRRWVLEAAREETIFWETWLARHPGRAEQVNQARMLVLAIEQHFGDNITHEAVDLEIAALLAKTSSTATPSTQVPTPSYSFWRRHWWGVAACILLAALGGWYYQQTDIASKDAMSYQSQSPLSHTLQQNNGQQPMSIRLPDGSLVVLEPGSQLRYLPHLEGKYREVHLSGEGFFQVTKNSYQPFLVYANGTVTKVLGTSFRVKAYAKEPTVSVAVKTGQVSFYAAQEYEKLQRKDLSGIRGVILTPNQRGLFHLADNHLEKELVEVPDLLPSSTPSGEWVFEDRPVPEVLRRLESSYGIDIVYDGEALARCPITTTFQDEGLYERLNLICQAIGSSYEVVDGQIIINSSSQNCASASGSP